MPDAVSEAERRDREWWRQFRARAEAARKRGESTFDFEDLATSAEGRLALAMVSAISNYAARQRRLESPSRQISLLNRYCRWRTDGARPEDRSRQVAAELDPALIAVASQAAGPWQLEELTSDLRGSRSVIERRLDELCEIGDRLLDDDPSVAGMQLGPVDGPGLPPRSWHPAPSDDEGKDAAWTKIKEETAAPKVGG